MLQQTKIKLATYKLFNFEFPTITQQQILHLLKKINYNDEEKTIELIKQLISLDILEELTGGTYLIRHSKIMGGKNRK